MLEIREVHKAFPGVKALKGVSITLRGGEIHALLGENGAGKSTLIKVVAGVHQPDEGTVVLDGEPLRLGSTREALAAGISVVHQERNLIPTFSVGENIMLERLPGRGGFVDYGQLHGEARQWLAALDLDLDPRLPVNRLSVAQAQAVEIARALSLRSRILLLDEPTTSLSPHETEILFERLRRLRDEGVALVFVSHKLEEVFDLCDRVTVLRDGLNTAVDRRLAELSRSEVVTLMIGRREQITRFEPKEVDRGEPALEVRGLETAFGHRDVSFALRRGEILGLYGLVGSGRTELAKSLIGADRVVGGEILVNGRKTRIRNVNHALLVHRIGYVSEDRKGEGLILTHSVRKNIGITIWDRLRRLGFASQRAERIAVEPYVERLAIKTPSLAQATMNLSGGNQQKVSVAKWLAAQVEVLIIDEPTVGIDIKTKDEMHGLIWDLAARGTAILLISSDMPEMLRLADRVLVVSRLRVVEALDNTHDHDEMSHRIMNAIVAAERGEAAGDGLAVGAAAEA